MRAAAIAIGAPGPSHILGFGDAVTPGAAALANGTFATALVFDDTHQETIIHVSTPIISSALAVAELAEARGAEVITAVVGGSELLCRLGLIAPRQFHKHGLHPTGVLGAVGSAYVAGRLLGLDRKGMQSAVGLVGSMSSGISEAFADGTWSHLMNAGWGAQSGIAAALVARTGFTGPATALEGRFGLFRSHLQAPDVRFDFDRLSADLGQTWETRKIAPKFYPCAHVIHPFLDCLLGLARQHDLVVDRVARITCLIADWMVPVVCTPESEKRRPVSDFQARTSLQYSLAEALYRRALDASAYDEASLRNAEILSLADRVEHIIDDKAPASDQYKGWVRIETTDGLRLERIVVHGDPEPGPEIAAKIREKFDRCLAVARRSGDADEMAAAITQLDKARSMTGLIGLCSRRAD